MAFAIVKLSYNQPGDSTLTGGICGTGFFVDSSTAVTAHHVLNDATFAPNAGYRHVLLWMISRNGSIRPLAQSTVTLFPDVDLSVIRVQNSSSGFQSYDIAHRDVTSGTRVRGLGHVGNAMPSLDARWEGPALVIQGANLGQSVLDTNGYVARTLTLDINAADVKMLGIHGFELSFGSQVGMSGGPVLDADNGHVLGMLSIGLPPDADVKTQTFAVSIAEIMARVR